MDKLLIKAISNTAAVVTTTITYSVAKAIAPDSMNRNEFLNWGIIAITYSGTEYAVNKIISDKTDKKVVPSLYDEKVKHAAKKLKKDSKKGKHDPDKILEAFK